jgi:hypothetical protein
MPISETGSHKLHGDFAGVYGFANFDNRYRHKAPGIL